MKSIKVHKPGTLTPHRDFEGEPLRIGEDVVLICYSSLARGIIMRATSSSLVVMHDAFFTRNNGRDFKGVPPDKWPLPNNDNYYIRTITDFTRIMRANTHTGLAGAWLGEIYYNRPGLQAKPLKI